ncbi:DUF4373 domain-containing protein [Cytobacillus horneckiae]|uniref:DUF4373 domain-containing protein n=1 Tax=Cytobacillus horneckiae TaxID=549687 RepID=A0A2N0ZB65_9BACI|nr:DUF4373 domain-containing protein [Cytobacillus horneckiae]MEC1155514.1 DUF4373 domain-containing protein [Cytobacillus horneckiae]MED2936833.1 DUF4373 domain-containing protein [Cytobacillus horneckiae]PKG26746.1 DUF4373 domain-containing protein [Cytobacillus horneckiae]
MSKEAYYFSHDANARHDPKILALRSEYGVKGYGIFWIIIEMLRNEDDYKLPIKNYVWNAIAMQVQCNDFAKDDAKQFVEFCINECDLFKNDDEFFWSESLVKRMEKKESVSQKRSAAAKARWSKANDTNDSDNPKNANVMQNDANVMQSDAIKGKESKVKESIYIVFDYWISKKIINHKTLTDKTKSHIQARLKEYTLDEVQKAIDNYAKVLFDNQYYWTHKWTLQDFMKPNNLIRFLDESEPLKVFQSSSNSPKSTKGNTQVDFNEFV